MAEGQAITPTTPVTGGATVGTGATDSEVLHALPGTQIFQQIGAERRLVAEGELQVLLYRGEGLARDTALLYLGSFTVAIRKGTYIVREDRVYALSFDGHIYRIVINPFIDQAVFQAFDLQIAAEADLSVREPVSATGVASPTATSPPGAAPAPKKSIMAGLKDIWTQAKDEASIQYQVAKVDFKTAYVEGKQNIKNVISDAKASAKRYRHMTKEEWAATKAKMDRDVQRESALLQRDIDRIKAEITAALAPSAPSPSAAGYTPISPGPASPPSPATTHA